MPRANRHILPGLVWHLTHRCRGDCKSELIAVGSESFVAQVKAELGFRAKHRLVAEAKGAYTLREPAQPYGDHFDRENEALRPNNAVLWQIILEITED